MSSGTSSNITAQAMAHFQCGRKDQAIQLLSDAATKPGVNVEILNLLGAMLGSTGRSLEAVEAFRKAVALRPQHAESHNNLANALRAVGQKDAAIDAFRRAVQLRPGYPQAVISLAGLLGAMERESEAIDVYRKAIAAASQTPEFHCNLSRLLCEDSDLTGAISSARTAISLRESFPEAWVNLGNALIKDEQADQAMVAFERAIALRPTMAEAHFNVGAALQKQRRWDEAAAAYERAISFKADYKDALNNLGSTLMRLGRADDGLAAIQRAVALKPDDADALANLGIAFQALGRLEESVAVLRRVIASHPDHAEAHWILAVSLLLKGNLAEAWPEYEWRLRLKDSSKPEHAKFARWHGEALDGRTIVLYAEQGFGDSIQFVRYVPLVAARGGRVLLDVPPELHGLFRKLPGIEAITQLGQLLPRIELQCPLMSLPMVFGTAQETIPREMPYLPVDEEKSRMWQLRIDRSMPVKHIGLVWAGRPTYQNDRNRSLALSVLSPLAKIPNVRLYSLQKGTAAAEATALADQLPLIDWTDELNDFSDTAALVSNLDLIIAVDTAVAHLAGALGRPIWVLLPFSPDYRWMLDRRDSPWYPTMKLFRQEQAGDWENVVEKLVVALRDYVNT
jgi:tetratricopeptide (TPR) repeat protein